MKCFLLANFLSLLQISTIFCQSINWQKTSHWKLYNIRDDNACGYSFDTLSQFKSTDMDSSKMQVFLRNVKVLSTPKYAMWMGLYVTTCQLEDGTIRKIDISKYGGFFYDEKKKSYYELPSELSDEWLKYMRDCLKIFSK